MGLAHIAGTLHSIGVSIVLLFITYFYVMCAHGQCHSSISKGMRCSPEYSWCCTMLPMLYDIDDNIWSSCSSYPPAISSNDVEPLTIGTSSCGYMFQLLVDDSKDMCLVCSSIDESMYQFVVTFLLTTWYTCKGCSKGFLPADKWKCCLLRFLFCKLRFLSFSE